MRLNPIHNNEPFTCLHCGKENSKATKSCRNHCTYCLYSQHVDENTPGDRLSNCKSLMIPVAVITNTKKGRQLVHQCKKCNYKRANMVSEDDNLDMLTTIMQQQNLQQLPEQF